MLQAIVRKHGYDVDQSWYDLAYNTGVTADDEIQKAMEAFSKG